MKFYDIFIQVYAVKRNETNLNSYSLLSLEPGRLDDSGLDDKCFGDINKENGRNDHRGSLQGLIQCQARNCARSL